ncbi:glycosyltransferase [Trueperella bialowiezensis]|uniref:dTDP-Rha:alpha-D-GlcNAc-pyrophosphate polyprenol, alpha-3-L-rhamnosyltransferase n=1 Tax=Trueperella bialowiezensis TaxID=312285 RepID=A0A3S4V683_9ACTO|nr:glycosyltransferase family 2 protein [Trueperella bialowiezensis]VEI12935.1 dTDP-Rha:alpha-D-GlcNAc-pyrophosphate polyprenol, alpha-3-L-rhamnosyltransferase [Trueperella bialowiezensis]
MVDVRVVTVAFNPGQEIEQMADSLPAAFADSKVSWELVVVNNGDSAHVLDELSDRARIIDAGANLGYGGGNNLGARGHDGEWLLFVNPDVTFHPGCVQRLLEVADHYPQAGVFGPKILTPQGAVYPSARRFPRLVAGTGHALFANVWPDNPWSAKYRAVGDANTTHTADWLSGSCLLVRAQDFFAVGGFDREFFMFFEDTMLGEAMERAGRERVFVHDALITHDQGASWRDRPAPMLRAHHESAYKYLARVYSGPCYAPVRLVLKAGLKARLAIQIAGSRANRPQR